MMEMLCQHCNKTIACDCEATGLALIDISAHQLNCSLRLFLKGNSHNGAGPRGEYTCQPHEPQN